MEIADSENFISISIVIDVLILFVKAEVDIDVINAFDLSSVVTVTVTSNEYVKLNVTVKIQGIFCEPKLFEVYYSYDNNIILI